MRSQTIAQAFFGCLKLRSPFPAANALTFVDLVSVGNIPRCSMHRSRRDRTYFLLPVDNTVMYLGIRARLERRGLSISSKVAFASLRVGENNIRRGILREHLKL